MCRRMADDGVGQRRSDRQGAGNRNKTHDKTAQVQLRVGDQVLARWKGHNKGGYFAAKVVADNNNGTFSLKYADGDLDERVPVWYIGKSDPEIKHADGAYVDCQIKVARGVGVLGDEVHGGFKRMHVAPQVQGEDEDPLGMRIFFDYDYSEVDGDGTHLCKEVRSVTLDNIVLEEDPCVAEMHYRALLDFMEVLYTTPPVSKEDMQRLLGPTAGKDWTKAETKRLEANFAVFKRARDQEEEKRSGAGSSSGKRRK